MRVMALTLVSLVCDYPIVVAISNSFDFFSLHSLRMCRSLVCRCQQVPVPLPRISGEFLFMDFCKLIVNFDPDINPFSTPRPVPSFVDQLLSLLPLPTVTLMSLARFFSVRGPRTISALTLRDGGTS